VSKNHERYHFSVKVQASDSAVLHCLRAINQWAQLGAHAGAPSIGWGGTGKRKHSSVKKVDSWETLRFTSAERRDNWESKANELLAGLWVKGETRDDDPASPVRI
jgi:hypothetical protein